MNKQPSKEIIKGLKSKRESIIIFLLISSALFVFEAKYGGPDTGALSLVCFFGSIFLSYQLYETQKKINKLTKNT